MYVRAANRSRIWAITCYFPFDDPDGDARRLRAYREFRRRLQVPLATVELARNGRFDLDSSDAEALIQVAGGATLWQKERLLNLALAALPAECDTLVWSDCDVVLTREDWPQALDRELERSVLVQPFAWVHYLSETTPQGRLSEAPSTESRRSVAALIRQGALPEESFRARGYSNRLGYSPGLVWAARRELLERRGFYDSMVLGSGDKAILSAALGRQHDYVRAYCGGEAHAEHYVRWADRFARSVDGRVGLIEGDAYHLFHGDLSNRGYSSRYEGFERFRFDPGRDLRLAASGAWEWSGGKPEMEEFVRRSFERRREAIVRAEGALPA